MQFAGGSRKLSHCPSSVKHQESPGVGFNSQVKSGAFWTGALDLTVSVYSEGFNSQPHTPAIHIFYTGKDGLMCSHLKKRKEKRKSQATNLPCVAWQWPFILSDKTHHSHPHHHSLLVQGLSPPQFCQLHVEHSAGAAASRAPVEGDQWLAAHSPHKGVHPNYFFLQQKICIQTKQLRAQTCHRSGWDMAGVYQRTAGLLSSHFSFGIQGYYANLYGKARF